MVVKVKIRGQEMHNVRKTLKDHVSVVCLALGGR